MVGPLGSKVDEEKVRTSDGEHGDVICPSGREKHQFEAHGGAPRCRCGYAFQKKRRNCCDFWRLSLFIRTGLHPGGRLQPGATSCGVEGIFFFHHDYDVKPLS